MGCRQLHCWQHQWCEKYLYDQYSIWYHQKEWCTKVNSQQLASFMRTKFKWKHSISRQAELHTFPMDAKWGYEKLRNALELASLCPLLETQPDALHQIIINASSSMLALSRSIFEGETRYQKFGQSIQMIDSKTGVARTRTKGTPITTDFITQSIWKTNNPAFSTSDIHED